MQSLSCNKRSLRFPSVAEGSYNHNKSPPLHPTENLIKIHFCNSNFNIILPFISHSSTLPHFAVVFLYSVQRSSPWVQTLPLKLCCRKFSIYIPPSEYYTMETTSKIGINIYIYIVSSKVDECNSLTLCSVIRYEVTGLYLGSMNMRANRVRKIANNVF